MRTVWRVDYSHRTARGAVLEGRCYFIAGSNAEACQQAVFYLGFTPNARLTAREEREE